MIETLALGYSSEITPGELSNEYQHATGLNGFQKPLCPFALDGSILSIGRVKALACRNGSWYCLGRRRLSAKDNHMII